jgi:glutathione synthase/RimK-type ligase-like ATP-grasp enzyme
MFDSADGPKVFDLNSSPGINEIEAATGIDIAKSMIERAVELAQLGRAERRR